MITRFIGPKYRFLSNFYRCGVWFDGMKFRSAEHAYQAAKSLDRRDRVLIQRLSTPGEAKRAGQKLKARPHWDKIKPKVMLRILESKFTDPYLSKLLVDTFPQGIVEMNTWGDTYWGVDMRTGEGSNMLGKLLMLVRESIMRGGKLYTKAHLKEYEEEREKADRRKIRQPVSPHSLEPLPELPDAWDHSKGRKRAKKMKEDE